MADLYDIELRTLDGEDISLDAFRDKALLVVNVASRCGLTPQYADLERLHKQYEQRGFTVLGFPCNQFAGQEPGSSEEIRTFCSANYGVTFPMFERIEVNGPGRHPLYTRLTRAADASGESGDIQWNFEKFLVSPRGEVVGRYRPRTEPEAEDLVTAVEAQLPR
ncbi:glutathione peroxidase [Streptomyces johnsoniae]|uniref:Glutathione peroxidase n=1 Tax=Streptomyces johnsoniae TaxID=3075532 RepID=A0ABU2SCC7_9ACTN|nr:glutathione peroxidase [Streptomyces sp. DSM 41886]MDT0446593.1 glutathione peroxidase [Streptomyces sp. DSM 41886]